MKGPAAGSPDSYSSDHWLAIARDQFDESDPESWTDDGDARWAIVEVERGILAALIALTLARK